MTFFLFSAPAHPQHASIAGLVPHAALTNPRLSATFFDTIFSFSIRARNWTVPNSSFGHIRQPPAHASFVHTPVSDIPGKYGIPAPACHPGYSHRPKTKRQSSTSPAAIILRDPESHNTGRDFRSSFPRPPRIQTQTLHSGASCIRLQLLHRIQTASTWFFTISS